MAEVTTYGFPYSLSDPFAEGHVLTATQATALNQLRAENISHKVRSALVETHSCKKGTVITEGSPEHTTLLEVAQREDQSYEFGQTVTRARDPMQVALRKFGRMKFDQLLAKQKPGFKVGKRDGSDVGEPNIYPYEKMSELVASFMANDKKVIEAARAEVKAQTKVTSESDDEPAL